MKHTSTFDLLDDNPEIPDTRFVLGILGHSSSSKWNSTIIAESIMNPFLSQYSALPEKIMMPAEGSTSLLIEAWASRHNIDVQVMDANWVRTGKKARVMRDTKILKESTHLLFFLGSRSDYYEKIAFREAKKGRRVYTVGADKELEEWFVN